MHKKCGKMLPPSEETDVVWCCSLVGWDLLLFPVVALLPSAFDVGFISSMLNESYKSQEVTSTPRNELCCIIPDSFRCIIIKGTYSWAKIYISYYAPKFLAEGLWKGLRVGRGCSCSCVIGMSPAGAQGTQKRGRLCFQITLVSIFLLVLIYIFFHLFYIHLRTQRKNACNSIPRSFLWPPTHTKKCA